MISILRQIAKLEAMAMSIKFPVGGSLYFTDGLTNAPRPNITCFRLEDQRFCVGPDTHPHLWQGRRSELDVHRGPCMSISILVSQKGQVRAPKNPYTYDRNNIPEQKSHRPTSTQYKPKPHHTCIQRAFKSVYFTHRLWPRTNLLIIASVPALIQSRNLHRLAHPHSFTPEPPKLFSFEETRIKLKARPRANVHDEQQHEGCEDTEHDSLPL